MDLEIRLDDEPGFQRAALRLIAWSASAGFVAAVASELAGDPRSAWPLGAAAAPIAASALLAAARARKLRAVGIIVAFAGALAAGVPAAARLSAPLARLSWFGWMWAPCAGAIMGAIATLAVLAAHLVVRRDPVKAAWRRAEAGLDGEARGLAERALDIWRRVESSCDRRSPMREAMQGAALRLLEMARRARLDGDTADLPSDGELRERIQQVQRKAQEARDEVTRGQYRSTEQVLGEQLRTVAVISESRERVMARMHHHVAAMDRLRLAAISLHSADVSCQSAGVQPLVEELARLGEDMEHSSQGLREAEIDGGEDGGQREK